MSTPSNVRPVGIKWRAERKRKFANNGTKNNYKNPSFCSVDPVKGEWTTKSTLPFIPKSVPVSQNFRDQ